MEAGPNDVLDSDVDPRLDKPLPVRLRKAANTNDEHGANLVVSDKTLDPRRLPRPISY
jgi:hypothetical protein